MATSTKAMALSAASGILLGALSIGCGGSAPGAQAPGVSDPTSTAKACCKGKNECAGKGGCKTDKNACAGKNECAGKGGCNAHCPKT